MTTVLLLLGLVLLVIGAELLVRGASRIALALRIPPLVVGLTVVAFGTSAPELAVSTSAALLGETDIALGNVVGSNIFNVLLILGLSALIAPLRVSAQLVRLDVPVMIGVSVLVLLMAWNGQISRIEGVALMLGLAVYLVCLFRMATGEAAGGADATADPSLPPGAAAASGSALRGTRALIGDGLVVAIGLALLVQGSRWLVDSAREIATSLGVSELMIGLTIVAAGTSLPELATSIVAALRGQRDIAVGNVVGSNIFNILGILGIAAAVAPDGLAATPAAVTFDIPVMTAVALVCLPVFFSGGTIARWEGAIFVGYYIAYTAYLTLDATAHGALPAFRDAMLFFVVPLTSLTLVVVAVRPLSRRRRRGD